MKRAIAAWVVIVAGLFALLGWFVGMALDGVVDVAKQIAIDFEASKGVK